MRPSSLCHRLLASVTPALIAASCGLAGCSEGNAARFAPAVLAGDASKSLDVLGRNSWMAPGAASNDLLYVSDAYTHLVDVYSWLAGKLEGAVTGFSEPDGDCVDVSGDVWITDTGSSQIIEYARAGTSPIATLNDPDQLPADCAVDPTSGDLAVSNVETAEGARGSVSIYKGARGTPQIRTDPSVAEVYFLAYDDRGNLYLDGVDDTAVGFLFAEIPSGSNGFTNITLNQAIQFPGGVLWDGKHVAVGDQNTPAIYQFRINGSTGTKVGSTALTGFFGAEQFWKQGKKIAVVEGGGIDEGVGIWNYPGGGAPKKLFKGLSEPSGAAISPGT